MLDMEYKENRIVKPCKDSKVIQTHRVLPSDLNKHRTLYGGTLMSYIDNTASISAARHARMNGVTASIDSLDFLHPIEEDHSVCVECYVSGVGTSSLEVFVKVMGENLMTGNRYLAATCFLTFVIKSDTKDQIVVPFVKPETEEEKFVCSGYQERRQQRLTNQAFKEQFAKAVSYCAPWLNSDCSVEV
jgi:acyl-CoA hydrolase